MGDDSDGPSHYSKLKSFGTKTAKVKQRDLLNELYLNEMDGTPGARVTDQQFEMVSKGVCLSLVGFWVSEKLSGASSLERGTGKSAKQQLQNQAVVMRAVPAQVTYAERSTKLRSGGKPFLDKHELSAERVGAMPTELLYKSYSLAPDPTWKNRNLASHEAFTQMLSLGHAGFAFHMHLRTPYPAHAVALFQVSADEWLFFDANIGEYFISGKSNAKQFLLLWRNLHEAKNDCYISQIGSTRLVLGS